MSKILLSKTETALIKILCGFNDTDFHLVHYNQLPSLVNEFNNAVERLEEMFYIETEGENFTASFQDEDETPQNTLKTEFSVKLIDKSICTNFETY